MLSSAALFLSIFSGTYAAIGPSATLTIANKQISPDGFQRSSTLANGVFPGPLITGNKASLAGHQYAPSYRQLLGSLVLHWHGFFQKGTNWEDGPAFVTQCPIAANHSFQYAFAVPQQTGTFWYHSHLSTQYCDGLRGPIVVYDPADPAKHLYDVDNDATVITLADWYHYPSPAHPTIPVFNSTLINGLGRYAGGPSSALSVISVTHGLRYRFRLVSISCDPNWIFSIDGHNMTIIEVDGVNHQPLTVDNIQIYAGQRYSFVLTASQPIGNYWIRANPQLAGSNQGFAGGINSAILRYVTAPAVDPTSTSTLNNALLETSLRPLVPTVVPGKPVPGGADVKLNLAIGLTPDFKFTFGGASFTPPTAPVLLQILSGAQSAQDLLPPGSVYTLPPNKVIEISVPGGSPGSPHPIHLHGHNFFVVRSAGSSTYNFVNPVIRDVVNTGVSTTDNTTFRFVTDNAGPWFLHCHIDWHLDSGLAVVMAEDTATISKENPPPAWDQLCPIYNSLSPGQL
ncbi:yellow laccase [Mycena filopes]|nr:yellow laccase [Mycena filopes]